MIRSMTAFARASLATAHGTLVAELRSVNHRYLDCHFKLPDELRMLEPELRTRLTTAVARGKIDCLLRVQQAPVSQSLAIDREALARVLDACREISDAAGALTAPSPLAVLEFPGVLRTPKPEADTVGAEVLTVFDEALGMLAETREREGEALKELVEQRISAVATEVSGLRDELPALREGQQRRLRSRLAELRAEVDGERLEQELAMLAQRADVDEELDRLDAHVAEVRRILGRGGPCGRRLDFLMQELNREANTLSSKSAGISQTRGAVELKVLIEQMREQVQNIE